MQVYRIAHPDYARDLSGYGGLIVVGRWHFKGNRVLYTSENSSLALLEYLVHTEGLARTLPYELITIQLPEESIAMLDATKLSRAWKRDMIKTRQLGSDWLESKASLALKVPSVINDDNSNILINPVHPDFGEVKIVSAKVITFDKRL